MRRSFTIDTADLPAHEANELHHLVQAADLPELARTPAAAPNPRAPDQFYYRLTIEDKNQRHSVVVSDLDVPEKVRSLIDWLHVRFEKD